MTVKDSDGRTASCFLVVGHDKKPATWRLPVKDPDGTPNHRLMGAAYAALTSNSRGEGYDGPDAGAALKALKSLYAAEKMDLPDAAAMSVSLTADFSADADDDGEMVVRRGKVFELGDYPDKRFSLDAAEMDAAIAAFAPVDLDVGDAHIPTLLSGKMGTLARVWKGEDGVSLFGEVRMPKWLDALLEDGERKVSTEWNRATKRLQRLVLVKNPRVSDAALMSAYVESGGPPEERDTRLVGMMTDAVAAAFAAGRHDTPSGQGALQSIHDMSLQNGARCRKGVASMASFHESQAMQGIHDMCAAHGATCETTGGTGTPADKKTFSATRSARVNLFDWIKGKAAEDGIEVDEEELKAAFSGQDAESRQKIADLEKALADEREANAAVAERNAAEFARLEGERRHELAVGFAQNQIAAKRIVPASSETLTALAERIASLDATATFAEGETATLELLAAFVASLPDLGMFSREHVTDESMAALFGNATTTTKKDKVDPERVKRVKQATALGRQALAEEAKSAANGKQ